MAQQVAVVGQHPADMFCAQSVREEIGFGPRALGVDDDEVARRVNEICTGGGARKRRPFARTRPYETRRPWSSRAACEQ